MLLILPHETIKILLTVITESIWMIGNFWSCQLICGYNVNLFLVLLLSINIIWIKILYKKKIILLGFRWKVSSLDMFQLGSNIGSKCSLFILVISCSRGGEHMVRFVKDLLTKVLSWIPQFYIHSMIRNLKNTLAVGVRQVNKKCVTWCLYLMSTILEIISCCHTC